MQHLSITFPQGLKLALDREARRERTKRSTLIQKAVRVYLELKHKRVLNDLMREGYQEMSGLARDLEEEFRILDQESLKYAD